MGEDGLETINDSEGSNALPSDESNSTIKPDASAPIEIIQPAKDDVVHVNQVELRIRFNDESARKFSVSVKGKDGKEAVQVKDGRGERAS
ncbi:MAG: hypothetical protein AB7U82_01845 [Blastocatellales bacterium]